MKLQWLNWSRVRWLSYWVMLSTMGMATPSFAVPSCSIESVVGVNFGAYDVFNSAPNDSTGSITYRCTEVAPGTITIDISQGNSGSFATRQMRQGSDSLNYNFYLDPTRTTVWGDGSSGTSQYGPVAPGENVSTSIPVYGRIPAQQTSVPVGNYSDTVSITINF
ncbi:spore coat U domain-containing protein [Alkalinema pantanalense CENA528]|uniref:Csu type fimbrial protein n=1 Tax=Alkalinema pantanalense TaxID=1620705 RepID=UPI003D6F39CD